MIPAHCTGLCPLDQPWFWAWCLLLSTISVAWTLYHLAHQPDDPCSLPYP